MIEFMAEEVNNYTSGAVAWMQLHQRVQFGTLIYR